MPAKDIQPIVSEYHILWEALKHYEERLEKNVFYVYRLRSTIKIR